MDDQGVRLDLEVRYQPGLSLVFLVKWSEVWNRGFNGQNRSR